MRKYKAFFLFTAMDPGEETKITTKDFDAKDIIEAYEKAENATKTCDNLIGDRVVGVIEILSENGAELMKEALGRR